MNEPAQGAPPARADGLTVVVVTYDRAAEVTALLGYLAGQTHLPDEVVVVGAAASHLPPEPDGDLAVRLPVRLFVSEAGTCRQRNVGLDALGPDCRYVVFLDDDYVPAPDALEGVLRAFEADPGLVGLEGVVLEDGVTRGGIERAEAERLVAEDAGRRGPPARGVADTARTTEAGTGNALVPVRDNGLYGCNMAYRVEALGSLRFDEALPLYGWQEDVDFAARIGERGALARAEGFRGVHRGVSRGRASGTRTGYSQVANPHYLVRKGTLSAGSALRLVLRNGLANHVRTLRPEPWVDRAGRVRGNWLAVADLLRGRLHPGRILDIP